MPLMSDSNGTYSIGHDGEKNYGTLTSIVVQGQEIMKYDPSTQEIKLKTGTYIPNLLSALLMSFNPKNWDTLKDYLKWRYNKKKV